MDSGVYRDNTIKPKDDHDGENLEQIMEEEDPFNIGGSPQFNMNSGLETNDFEMGDDMFNIGGDDSTIKTDMKESMSMFNI